MLLQREGVTVAVALSRRDDCDRLTRREAVP